MSQPLIVSDWLVFCRALHMKSTVSTLLLLLFHVLNNIGELSLYLLTLIRFQEGK